MIIFILETEGEVDSATEKRLLESTEESSSSSEIESENLVIPRVAASPIKESELLQFRLDRNNYSFDEINSPKYWREVRTILETNMGLRDRLTSASFFIFDDHFQGKKGIKCRIPKPSFDAWCLVTGRVREGFDVKGFCLSYPNTDDLLRKIRGYLEIIVNRPPIDG